jgi:hypothetical protein
MVVYHASEPTRQVHIDIKLIQLGIIISLDFILTLFVTRGMRDF